MTEKVKPRSASGTGKNSNDHGAPCAQGRLYPNLFGASHVSEREPAVKADGGDRPKRRRQECEAGFARGCGVDFSATNSTSNLPSESESRPLHVLVGSPMRAAVSGKKWYPADRCIRARVRRKRQPCRLSCQLAPLLLSPRQRFYRRGDDSSRTQLRDPADELHRNRSGELEVDRPLPQFILLELIL
jgi:hypothetical protein